MLKNEKIYNLYYRKHSRMQILQAHETVHCGVLSIWKSA